MLNFFFSIWNKLKLECYNSYFQFSFLQKNKWPFGYTGCLQTCDVNFLRIFLMDCLNKLVKVSERLLFRENSNAEIHLERKRQRHKQRERGFADRCPRE